MAQSQFLLRTNNFNKIADFVADLHSYDYVKRSGEMAIFVLEEYHLFSGFYQTNYFVIYVKDTKVYIDVVGGAAGKGTMIFAWGWHRRFIKRFRKKISLFCEHNDIYFEEFEPTKFRPR